VQRAPAAAPRSARLGARGLGGGGLRFFSGGPWSRAGAGAGPNEESGSPGLR